MKKIVLIAALAFVAGVGVAGIFAVRGFVVESASAQAEPSEADSEALQAKVNAIKLGEKAGEGRQPARVEVSESELESYVMFALRERIPARVDSIAVRLTPGSVAADTKLTFESNPTKNPMIDVLISGTHRFFLKGQLSAADGQGKCVLEEARVDGIPVPVVFIETLLEKYVKPRYPQVKLDQAFTMPWGIEALTITEGKATVD